LLSNNNDNRIDTVATGTSARSAGYFPPYANVIHDVKVRIKHNSNRKSHPILVQYVSIRDNDNVYDLDKIKYDAKKEKESFEKRSLDKILKRLVNTLNGKLAP
jgi:hypothetical protein